MKPLHAAIALGLAAARCCRAQESAATQDNTMEEARFAVSRGSNFTFQPSAGSLCSWAVAQYAERRHEFFNLESQPVCPPSVANVSTTLLVRFGRGSRPGNATLTVQCDEPSVWNFLVRDDGAPYQTETTVEPVCGEEEESAAGTGSSGSSAPYGLGASGYNPTGAPSNGLPVGPLWPTAPAGSPGNPFLVAPSAHSTFLTSFGGDPRGSDGAAQTGDPTSSSLSGPSSTGVGSYGSPSPGDETPEGQAGLTTSPSTQEPSATSSPGGDPGAPDSGGEAPGQAPSTSGEQATSPASASGVPDTEEPTNSDGTTSSSTGHSSPDGSAPPNSPSSSSNPTSPADPSSSDNSASPDGSPSSDSPASPDGSPSSDNPASPDDPSSPNSTTSPNEPAGSSNPDSTSPNNVPQGDPTATSMCAPCTCTS